MTIDPANVATLAERFHAAKDGLVNVHTEVEALIKAAEDHAGLQYRMRHEPNGVVTLRAYSNDTRELLTSYTFEGMHEACMFLLDSLTPTDTELLDKLDAALPFGLRSGVRGCLLPATSNEVTPFYKNYFGAQKPIRWHLMRLLKELTNNEHATELGTDEADDDDCGCHCGECQ